MSDIRINIEAYGAVSVFLPKDLSFTVASTSTVAQVVGLIDQQYPEASTMLEKCACAIGEDIVLRSLDLTNDTTLVLLSPVAGG